jgi:histidyl-tRNA synthetase
MSAARIIRAAGYRVHTYLGGSQNLGKQLKWAAMQGSQYSVLCDLPELSDDEVVVRNMETGAQESVKVEAIAGLF